MIWIYENVDFTEGEILQLFVLLRSSILPYMISDLPDRVYKSHRFVKKMLKHIYRRFNNEIEGLDYIAPCVSHFEDNSREILTALKKRKIDPTLDFKLLPTIIKFPCEVLECP